MLFGMSPLVALLPLVLYIILAFREVQPVLNVVICVALAALLTGQPLLQLGPVIQKSLGSFLALVGMIIMLGSALGAVLTRTGAARSLVDAILRRIGVNSPRKAIVAAMLTSFLLSFFLGTLAGANAILAPIIIPLVASMGVTPSTLAVIFQGAGQTGLFVGPFSPQVLIIRQVAGLSYQEYLLGAGLPVAVLCWLITYWGASRIQRRTAGIHTYSEQDLATGTDEGGKGKRASLATVVFLVTVVAMIVYGVCNKSGASYAVLVLFAACVTTGLAGGLKPGELFDTMMEGASRMVWLFVMFVLFDPMINFIKDAGAFRELVALLQPLVRDTGRFMFSLVASLTGIFGIGGAAVAQTKVMHEMFQGLVRSNGIPASLWAMILLVGSQITSFAYPEADMLGQMGLARSRDLKNMVRFGLTVVAGTIVLVGIRSLL